MVPGLFVELDRMPMQPNGKINRSALPAPEVVQIENEKKRVSPRTNMEIALAEIWEEVLGVKNVGVHDNFFELGGDSIISLQIAGKARKAGIAVNPRLLFRHQTIADLALYAEVTGESTPQQEVVVGPVPLTPIQRQYFDLRPAEPHHYNQSVLLEVRRRIEVSRLREVVARLPEQHDALRMSFFEGPDGWEQFNQANSEQEIMTVVDLSGVDGQGGAGLFASCCAQAQRSLNLEEGPLARVVLFDRGSEGSGRLLIVIHHLVVDGVSWRILLDDLQAGYEQALRREPVEFGGKTTSFKRWAEEIERYAAGSEITEEQGYWLEKARKDAARLPVDFDHSDNVTAEPATVRLRLGSDQTRALLSEVPASLRATINEVLITGLAAALSEWTGGKSLKIDLESHGRDEFDGALDLSRTVGWFTSIYPVVIEAKAGEPLSDVLRRVKEELRGVKREGIGYGAIKYLKEAFQNEQNAEVCFNYLGQLDQTIKEDAWLAVAEENHGSPVSEKLRRRYLLEINGGVIGGRLEFRIIHSEATHRRKTIESLASRWSEKIEQLTAESRYGLAAGYSASDFSLSRLTDEELDRIAAPGADIEDIYPLSPMQQGLLFHSVFEEGSGVYVQQLRCAFPEAIDPELLEEAWSRVIERHPILRTGFVWSDLDVPHQIVRRKVTMPVESRDLSGLPDNAQKAAFSKLADDDRKRGFDLSTPPLMRCVLVRVKEGVNLLWSHHHIILDGWCVPLVIKEVLAFYRALKAGESVDLPDAPPYSKYLEWLGRQDPLRAEQYWRLALAGLVSPLEIDIGALGDDRAREAAYHEKAISITRQETAALRDLARRNQLTLNTLVDGAWALLLSHYSKQEDVVFGATVAGRPAELPNSDSMIGVFINTLPLRVRVPPYSTLISWMSALQSSLAELRQFEHTSLLDVHRWSEMPKGLPLFETQVVFENYPVDESLDRLDDWLPIQDLKILGAVHYPLCLMVAPGSRLSITAMYNQARFDPAAIAGLLELMAVLLRGFVRQPAARLKEFEELLTLTETEARLKKARESSEMARQKLKNRLSARPR
jgi:non-ribosomal peptide synthase protein (TIGR01720 family)